MPEQHLRIALLDEHAVEPGFQVLDGSLDGCIDIFAIKSNAVSRQIGGAQIHRARALTLLLRLVVLPLEFQRLGLHLDPPVRVGNVRL